jgi:hypothetical protein
MKLSVLEIGDTDWDPSIKYVVLVETRWSNRS